MESSGAKLDPKYWRKEVSVSESLLVKRFFNKGDSDIAVITSQLADLHLTSLGICPDSKFTAQSLSQPASIFSSLESIRRIEELIALDPAIQKDLHYDLSRADSSSSDINILEEGFHNKMSPVIYRINTDSCLYFDFETNEMCKETAIDNTGRCIKHQEKAHSKFINILSALSDSLNEIGFNLSMSVFRSFSRPDDALSQEVYEYAPCLEGGLPAFKDSTLKLEKVLLAGWESYQENMLSNGTPFNDKYYRKRFPNIKTIGSHKYMHTYLATREFLKSLR